MSNFYVTTSIPYVNSEPHIGFAMELVQADVLARYARQIGAPTLFSTGTDEHGGKIAEKAAESKQTPQEFVDKISASFKAVLPLLDISNDRFVRTTDKGHEQRSQLIWKNLTPYIYKGNYAGWYCTGDEAFFSEKVVKENKGVCPAHNRPYEKIQEENYFFKLSAFTPQLKQIIETGSLAIYPETRKHEILSLINEGLDDISISRPKDKISWGIPVPGDTSQVMYVWFEALMNYITVLGYPENEDFKNFWPANIQVVGKDILRFHAAIWPAMLIGLKLPPPHALYVHGFVTVDDKKMSKTLGNVVAPKDIIDKYGTDTFRYFFLRHIPSYSDGDFSWERLEAAYNNELADQLGNAVSRTAAMLIRYQQGLIGTIPEAEHDMGPYHSAIEQCRFDRALDVVWEQVKGLNQYIEESKPWEIAKTGDQDHLREVLTYMVGALLEISLLLQPFMPSTSERINQILGGDTVKEQPAPLFPKHQAAQPKSD
jgi:methionyl-tRNA synthetase